MKPAILALALLGLVAGCQRDAAPAATTPSTAADASAKSRVEAWPLPATLPGSALPSLAVSPTGQLLLAWTNSPPGRRHALQFSAFDPAAQRWLSAPVTIAVGNRMFVNSADTPHIMAANDGALWVHWLQRTSDDTAAYDIMVSTSRNFGMRWSAPLVPHDDGTTTEHGFVSMWPQGPGGIGMAWLDGRNSGAAVHAGDGAHEAHSGGPMTLRAATLGADLRRTQDAEIDAMTCDCCQTDAAMTTAGPLLVYRGRTDGEVRDILATRFDGTAWSTPAQVHADGWTMPACPVNGPAVDAAGDVAVVGWYTAAGGTPRVQLARSTDAGSSFAAPVVLDAGEAVQGRIDVAYDGDQVWALWVREDASAQTLVLSRRSGDLATEHERIVLATLEGRGRATGFPRIVARGGVLYAVWTDVVEGAPRLQAARVLR